MFKEHRRRRTAARRTAANPWVNLFSVTFENLNGDHMAAAVFRLTELALFGLFGPYPVSMATGAVPQRLLPSPPLLHGPEPPQ